MSPSQQNSARARYTGNAPVSDTNCRWRKDHSALQVSVSHIPVMFTGIVICFGSCTDGRGWNNLLVEYRLKMAIVSGKDADADEDNIS